MDDLSNNTNTLSTAPPPPSEVKIRTMRSDLASMASSGGGAPRFENIKVSGLSAEKESAAVITRGESKNNLFTIILVVVVIGLLVAIGWFAYAKFFANSAAAVPEGQSNMPAAATTPKPTTQPQPTPVAVPTTTPVAAPATTSVASTPGEPPILRLGSTNSSSQP